MLGTIDQWTTFHTHHATVGLYLLLSQTSQFHLWLCPDNMV
jgi:hypothetical protein